MALRLIMCVTGQVRVTLITTVSDFRVIQPVDPVSRRCLYRPAKDAGEFHRVPDPTPTSVPALWSSVVHSSTFLRILALFVSSTVTPGEDGGCEAVRCEM